MATSTSERLKQVTIFLGVVALLAAFWVHAEGLGVVVFASALLIARTIHVVSDVLAARRRKQMALNEIEAAATELKIAEPQLCPGRADEFVSEGHIEGFLAELKVGTRGWHELLVHIPCHGISSDISLGPKPVGRAQEDFMLGVAKYSNNAEFDKHYAIFGSQEALKKAVPENVLNYMSDHYTNEFDLHLSSSALWLSPGRPWLPCPNAHSPRWVLSKATLNSFWRQAQCLVRDGLSRGLFG